MIFIRTCKKKKYNTVRIEENIANRNKKLVILCYWTRGCGQLTDSEQTQEDNTNTYTPHTLISLRSHCHHHLFGRAAITYKFINTNKYKKNPSINIHFSNMFNYI